MGTNCRSEKAWQKTNCGKGRHNNIKYTILQEYIGKTV
ncbi:hypothetical protein NU09_1706 [Flavobacterium beibuense]|uniref:Uncharacterized protein n=1 Tax=Flavobacterium beibuense TaxID=657326 RepID=A0A444WC26_9FLAO|nr:hypothetical protein NU09_1706 [Flavobacterium beibuense]